MSKTEIKFLKVREDYGFLSNFWMCDIEWEGKTYPSSEHLYQARKYEGTDPEYMELIRGQGRAWDAAQWGRKGTNLREDWEHVKVKVMLEVVRAKFDQNLDLAMELLATGDADLIEDRKADSFWGNGGDGSGHNWLGRILVRVRKELRDKYKMVEN